MNYVGFEWLFVMAVVQHKMSSQLLSKQVKAKEKEVRLLILGLDNAGKNIQTLEFKGFSLSLWDVGGQKSIRAYWKNYFESTDGLIWVVDSADRVRVELCKAELLSLLRQEKLAGASLLIFANKQDIVGALSSEEIAQVLELETDPIYQNRHWSIQSCSAVTGDGLAGGVEWIMSDISNRIFMMN